MFVMTLFEFFSPLRAVLPSYSCLPHEKHLNCAELQSFLAEGWLLFSNTVTRPDYRVRRRPAWTSAFRPSSPKTIYLFSREPQAPAQKPLTIFDEMTKNNDNLPQNWVFVPESRKNEEPHISQHSFIFSHKDNVHDLIP